MGAMRISLQLYTVREPAAADLGATLERARAAGFEYVQWSGMPDLSAEAIRRVLEDAGLEARAAHADVEAFEQDYEASVQFWQTVGATDVAPGGMMADCQDSHAAWLRGAARLDALGGRLRADGMRLSYHNHAAEFETFPEDDRCKLDVLYDATAPDHLFAELDTAWVHVGGADPAAYIRRYAGRCPVIHVKDVAAELRDGHPWFVPLGQGVLDWDGILRDAAESGVEWLIYEQDTHDGDPLESAAVSYEFLAGRV